MNTITNENGETVTAVGRPGSPARMKCKYPFQLSAEIESYKDQLSKGVKTPVITFEGDFHDHNDFHIAVLFFIKYPNSL